MTPLSSNCDVKSRVSVNIPSHAVIAIPVGVYIVGIDQNKFDSFSQIPEIQIRCRSSLALKHGLMLANGIGTIDADYRDEIKVLLWNSSACDYLVEKGERVAQMSLNLVSRIPEVPIANAPRTGGFGSTNKEC
jgi:dUTP pyrophosphatase